MAAAHPLPRDTALPNPAAAVQLGLAIAIILHLALLALLSVSWPESEKRVENPPMEVDLIADIAPQSTAPEISASPPAPKLGEVEEDAPPAPPPPKTLPPPPPPKAVPAKAPPVKSPPVKAPVAKSPPTKQPTTKAPPSKAPPSKSPPATRAPTGRLDGITDGLSKTPPKAPATSGAPAAQTAAEVRKSIDVAIDGEILPHWRRNVPSGIEIDQLRVVLQIQLNPNGSVADIRQKGELTGKTDSNKPQQALFVERAIRSIRQAAPFDLPSEYYDQWRVWDVTFRARGM